MKHLLFDTNVIIDFLADRSPFAEHASRLFDLAEKGKLTIYVSALSYSNIYYILSKFISHKETISLLKDIEMMTNTLEVSGTTIQAALNSGLKDFEDAIQLYTAIKSRKTQMIVTRDPKGFKTTDILVVNPEEAFRIVSKS
jgi:predicted nucleic acid-binding protein